MDIKDLRNEIAHEYETDDLLKLFSVVLEAVPQVFDITDRVVKYCKKYND